MNGDKDALQALYRIHRAPMVEFAHARLGPTLQSLTESVDLVQSVWTDLVEDIRGFEDRGPGSFEGWLRACVTHKILTKRRYFGAERRDVERQTAFADELHSARDPTPSQDVAHTDEVAQLLAILGRLPELQRRVLVLRLRDERGFADIAAAVGKSEEAAKKLYQRAFASLVERLPADWRMARD